MNDQLYMHYSEQLYRKPASERTTVRLYTSCYPILGFLTSPLQIAVMCNTMSCPNKQQAFLAAVRGSEKSAHI